MGNLESKFRTFTQRKERWLPAALMGGLCCLLSPALYAQDLTEGSKLEASASEDESAVASEDMSDSADTNPPATEETVEAPATEPSPSEAVNNNEEPPPVASTHNGATAAAGGTQQQLDSDLNTQSQDGSESKTTQQESYDTSPPTPFDQGRIQLGIGIGGASATDTSWMILGLGAGYFVLKGLEVEAGTSLWLFGDPFIATLSPGVRYVFHMVPKVKPYLATFYRHYFITNDLPDSDSIGGQVGAYYMMNDSAYLGLGLIYEHFLDSNLYSEPDQFYPAFTFSFTI